MDKQEQIELGYIDIPTNYFSFDEERKKEICNNIIDILLYELDKNLDPTINRITFLDSILESSLMSNEDLEQYEICECLRDCRKSLND